MSSTPFPSKSNEWWLKGFRFICEKLKVPAWADFFFFSFFQNSTDSPRFAPVSAWMDCVRSWLMTAHPERTPALAHSLTPWAWYSLVVLSKNIQVSGLTGAQLQPAVACTDAASCLWAFLGKMEYFGRADAADASNCTSDQGGLFQQDGWPAVGGY